MADPMSTVKKNAWWYDECPKHGKQPHHAVLDDRCEKCAMDGDTADDTDQTQ